MILVNGAKVEQDHFSAGELKMKLYPYQGPVTVTWNYENDSEFFTLACIREFYNKNSMVDLVLPYFPHARMDRVKSEMDVFTLRTFCHLLNSLKFNRVASWDVHSNVTPALVDNFVNIDPTPWIRNVIQNFSSEDLVLFFPDEGAQKRYGGSFSLPQAFGIKKRNWETQKIEDYMLVGGEVVKDKKVLIIDDICSYGNTFVKAAEALRKAGAKEVYLYVTHCEEAVGKGDVFTCGHIDKVFTTHSLVRTQETDEKLFHA